MKLATIRLRNDDGSVGTRAVRVDGSTLVDLGAPDFAAVLATDGWRESTAAATGATYDTAGADYAPLVAYILRSFAAGGALARALFQHMVDDNVRTLQEGVDAGTLRPSRDPAARAHYLTLSSLGGMLLHLQLSDATDVQAALEELTDAVTLPTAEVYTRSTAFMSGNGEDEEEVEVELIEADAEVLRDDLDIKTKAWRHEYGEDCTGSYIVFN